MCVHTHHIHMTVPMWNQSSLSTFLWPPGMEFRPGLQGGAFTHGAKHGGAHTKQWEEGSTTRSSNFKVSMSYTDTATLNELPCLSKTKTKPLRCAHFADKRLQQTLDLCPFHKL